MELVRGGGGGGAPFKMAVDFLSAGQGGTTGFDGFESSSSIPFMTAEAWVTVFSTACFSFGTGFRFVGKDAAACGGSCLFIGDDVVGP